MKDIKELKPSITSLGEIIKNAGIKIDADRLEKLWAYHQLIRKNNDDQDLTRLNAFSTMAVKHYVDSLIVVKLLKTIPSPLLDIGTGAGFPGIPIKILCPEIKITLAEGRPKRVDFLNMVIKELSLKDANVHGSKVVSGSNLRGFNGIITRAFEDMSKTLVRVDKIINSRGQMIFMKGPNCEKEKGEALRASPFFKLSTDISYQISPIDDRRLIVFTRS